MSQISPVNKSWCLEQLCESNYHKLLQLIPNLQAFNAEAIGYADQKPNLHLQIVERSSYTITLQLSHCFDKDLELLRVPDVKIRLYLDAHMAEVLRDYKRPAVRNIYKDPKQSIEIMNYKWRLNYFLQKWLNHCLSIDYLFEEPLESVV